MYGRANWTANAASSLPWNCEQSGCTFAITPADPGGIVVHGTRRRADTNGGNPRANAVAASTDDEAPALARQHEADRIDAESDRDAQRPRSRDAAKLDVRVSSQRSPPRAVRSAQGSAGRGRSVPTPAPSARRRCGHALRAVRRAIRCPLAAPDRQQRADDVAHHVMQERIRLDLDNHLSPSARDRNLANACAPATSPGKQSCGTRVKSCSPTSACAARCMASTSSGRRSQAT